MAETNICRKEKWEALSRKVSYMPYNQTQGWAEAKKLEGWEVYHVLLEEGCDVLGGVQVLFKANSYFGAVGFIEQGPVLLNYSEANYWRLLQQVKSWVRSANIRYLVWGGCIACESGIDILIENGFIQKPNFLPPKYSIKATVIIDLSVSKDALLKRINRNIRRHITKGISELNNSFVIGKRSDIPVFFDLMLQGCKRRGVVANPNNIDSFYRLWDHLSPTESISLHIGKYNDIKTCAILCFCVGNTVSAYKWGWSGEYMDKSITHFTYWESIKWAKENGYAKYDLVQVDPEISELLLRKEELSSELKARGLYGSTSYKLQFGGEYVRYPHQMMYVSNWFVRTGLKMLLYFSPLKRMFLGYR